jgi:hypothetical protein
MKPYDTLPDRVLCSLVWAVVEFVLHVQIIRWYTP